MRDIPVRSFRDQCGEPSGVTIFVLPSRVLINKDEVLDFIIDSILVETLRDQASKDQKIYIESVIAAGL